MNTATITELTRETGWARRCAQTLNARAFGVNAYTKDAGEHVVGEHDELRSGHEELYLVVSGRARFTVDGDVCDAGPGTFVLVEPSSRRAALALEPHTTIVVVGGCPGEVFRPRAWETNAQIYGMFGEGRIEEAREILHGVVDSYEDGESIQYNLACCEARLGNVEEAFAHLARALDGREDLVELARDDEDLASLHDDPRFEALTGAVATQPG